MGYQYLLVQILFRFGFSQVSQPNRMSGLLESMRFHRAYRFLLMVWMFKQADLNVLSILLLEQISMAMSNEAKLRYI